MTEFAASASTSVWTCPFCPLACDHLGVRVGAADEALALVGGNCEIARVALGRFASRADPEQAEVDGRACAVDIAIAAAARLLAASRQPLFAGLGTDVAGARALYPLACATGAIVDSAGGDALMAGLRALQDRGQFTTTLAEVRSRADVIVFVGGLPTAVAPLIAQRCGIGEALVAKRHVVVVGPAPGDEATLATWATAGVSVEAVELQGDLFTTLALLQSEVGGREIAATPDPLRRLAQRLLAARYAVLLGAPARLPAQAGLAIEAVHQIVAELNRSSRAAALWLGGGNGAATANQVFSWLSGLPLRSRAGPLGIEHEPLAFASARLLADRAVDAMLWVSAFDGQALPPVANPRAQDLPLIVLGPPALATSCRRPGAVFIAVSTPGIGSDGHVFRTDGTVLMPLTAARRDPLMTVADAAQAILKALRSLSPGSAA